MIPMETIRISLFDHHTLSVETLADNQIKQEMKHFDSRREMLEWMRSHMNDGYYEFRAQSVSVEETIWVSPDHFQRMCKGYSELAEIRRRYG